MILEHSVSNVVHLHTVMTPLRLRHSQSSGLHWMTT